MSNLILVFLPMRAMIPRILPTKGMLWTDHLPRPSFSFSAYWGLEPKRGRLLEKRRMCRPKNPCLLVENEGYPAPLWLLFFNLVDSHMTGVPLDPGKPLVGLDRPLAMLRPGLAQPPPGTGDGLRDSDIGVVGVPAGEGQSRG